MRPEGRGRYGDGECSPRQKGAQTFRRGRALAFYRQLETRRDTLKKQLEAPELQSIHPVIAGELKATESIMNDFIELFQLNEILEQAQQED